MERLWQIREYLRRHLALVIVSAVFIAAALVALVAYFSARDSARTMCSPTPPSPAVVTVDTSSVRRVTPVFGGQAAPTPVAKGFGDAYDYINKVVTVPIEAGKVAYAGVSPPDLVVHYDGIQVTGGVVATNEEGSKEIVRLHFSVSNCSRVAVSHPSVSVTRLLTSEVPAKSILMTFGSKFRWGCMPANSDRVFWSSWAGANECVEALPNDNDIVVDIVEIDGELILLRSSACFFLYGTPLRVSRHGEVVGELPITFEWPNWLSFGPVVCGGSKWDCIDLRTAKPAPFPSTTTQVLEIGGEEK